MKESPKNRHTRSLVVCEIFRYLRSKQRLTLPAISGHPAKGVLKVITRTERPLPFNLESYPEWRG